MDNPGTRKTLATQSTGQTNKQKATQHR